MNISTLEQYVEQMNSWGKLTGGKPLSLLNDADRQRIAQRIDCELSPENLTCDGELSRTEVNARYKSLTAAAKDLIKLDPSVRMYEFA